MTYHLFPGNNEHLVLTMIDFFASKIHDDHVGVVYVVLFSKEDRKQVYNGLSADVVFVDTKKQLRSLIFAISKRDSAVLHSALYGALFFTLFLRPAIWSRCIWVAWGGDFYFDAFLKPRTLREKFRMLKIAIIIKRLGAIGTLVPGDYDLISRAVKCRTEYVRILYSTFCSDDYVALGDTADHTTASATVRVQLGNSAAPTNNHLPALGLLAQYSQDGIEIICPISYATQDSSYTSEVRDAGLKLFGARFQALTEMMSRDEYWKLVSTIDILVFNHSRQQGLGNLYHYLFSGKKVFLSSSSPTYSMLQDMGFCVYATETIPGLSFREFSSMPLHLAKANQRLAEENLSINSAITIWTELLARFSL